MTHPSKLAIATIFTIFLLSYVGALPAWAILLPLIQSIPLFAMAYDMEHQ